MTTPESSLLEHDEDVSAAPEAFPKLTGAQVNTIKAVARERTFQDGEVLWGIGDRHPSFYVVIEGAVDIAQWRARRVRHLVVRHGPGGFTGDVDLLSDNASVVEGRAYGRTRTLEVCPETLRKLVVADSSLSDVLLRAFLARRQMLLASGFGSVLLLGSRYSADTFRLREFLERNSRPFEWIDLDAEENVTALLDGFSVSIEDTPVMVSTDGVVYRNPTIEDLAACMGLSSVSADRIYDTVIVGAGPAGLAAGVYAASEGLDVLILDAIAPGGQASTSSKIENYLGFPAGISGRELAQRALVQAEKFGARLATPRRVLGVDCSERPYRAVMSDGAVVRCRTIVVATGARYRKLPLENAPAYEGRGIYFAATAMEARLCADEEVVVVGGGNSAGQAAVFLGQHARHVHVFIRSGTLAHTMSRYLIRRIDASRNITLHPHTEITALRGDESLDGLDATTGDRLAHYPVRHAFVFIGAAPNTEWLGDCLARDANGFIRTGRDVTPEELDAQQWPRARVPFLLETNRPGIFAAGDVRAGSTKRVASAVGEGSICVQFIHQAL